MAHVGVRGSCKRVTLKCITQASLALNLYVIHYHYMGMLKFIFII